MLVDVFEISKQGFKYKQTVIKNLKHFTLQNMVDVFLQNLYCPGRLLPL